MKLIDLIELLFDPLPVQFEPVPWVHGAADEFSIPTEYFFPTTEPGYPLAGHHFHYPNGAYEFVSLPRTVWPTTGPTLADLIRMGYLKPHWTYRP